jgi:MFS family permease
MTPAEPRGRERISGRRLVAISSAGALIPLNSTMIAVALPAISDDFDVDISTVSSLILAYLVVMLMVQPLAGRLTDRFGHRSTVRVTLTGLAAASIAALFAPVFWFLVIVRALQAIFSAALNPAVQSLLMSITDADDRGRAFGIHGSMMGVGAASGPVVGGVLVELFGWEAVFAFNVPVAMIAWLAVRSATTRAGTEARSGPSRPGTKISNSVFVAGYSAQALSTFAQYALLILTPIILDHQGWGAGSTGLVLTTLTLGMIVTGPAGGRLGDRVGRRLPSMVGLSVTAAVVAGLALFGQSVDPVVLVVGLSLFGLGLGVATPNLMSAAMGSVSGDRIGAAAGIFATARHVGSISSTAMIAVVVADDAGGTSVVLTVGAACLVASIAAALRLSDADRPDG